MLDQIDAVIRAIGAVGTGGATVLTISDGVPDGDNRRARRYGVSVCVQGESGVYPRTDVSASVVTRADDGIPPRPTMREAIGALHAMTMTVAERRAKALATAMEAGR